VLGNHDKFATHKYLMYFTHLWGVKFYDGVVLSHIPIHTDSLGKRATHNIHGHLHSKRVLLPNGDIDSRYINVGCEHINLTPIEWGDLKQQVQNNV
jgi:calcineurin-like phosphoesterase family protein